LSAASSTILAAFYAILAASSAILDVSGVNDLSRARGLTEVVQGSGGSSSCSESTRRASISGSEAGV